MSGGPAHLGFAREQLVAMDARFCAAMARAIDAGAERPRKWARRIRAERRPRAVTRGATHVPQASPLAIGNER